MYTNLMKFYDSVFIYVANLKSENISFINKISNIFVNNTKFYTDISN